MQRALIRDIHRYVARYSISASAARGQRAPGLVAAARDHLATIPLRSFGVSSERRFRTNLDRHTEMLRSGPPRDGRSWGLARKLLNIFLRNALYTGSLASRYDLDRAEDWFEVPLDSIVAKRLGEAPGVRLPRWHGVKHLTPQSSAMYQEAATLEARRRGFPVVHLDAVWWGGTRSVGRSRFPTDGRD